MTMTLGKSAIAAARLVGLLCLAALPLASMAAEEQTVPTEGNSAETSHAPGLQEVVVTATRHEESLSKVPISVTALTQDNMDQLGIKDFQDVARFTPGVTIDNSGTNAISIRGISSSGGAGTTGIYIDDTPIQMRSVGFNPGRHAAEDLRPAARRGAARPAGHAVRRRRRGWGGALHPDSAEHDDRGHLYPQRIVLYAVRPAERGVRHRARPADRRWHLRRARQHLVPLRRWLDRPRR